MTQTVELRRRIAGWLPVRVFRLYLAISGYDRALALATQAFVALVPMLIVVASALPDSGRASAGRLVDQLNLSGTAAAELQQLLQRPPGAAEPVTLLGGVLLVVSVLGFTRTLQRTYLAAWGLPSLGLWGYVRGLVGAAALVGEVVLIIAVGLVLKGLLGAEVLATLVRLGLAVLLWWPVQRLLLGDRVGWRPLLPGAVIAGTGQELVLAVSGVYLQPAIEAQSARYGLIGVAFVLVSWLIALGLLLVLGAVVGAELGSGTGDERRVPCGARTPGQPLPGHQDQVMPGPGADS